MYYVHRIDRDRVVDRETPMIPKGEIKPHTLLNLDNRAGRRRAARLAAQAPRRPVRTCLLAAVVGGIDALPSSELATCLFGAVSHVGAWLLLQGVPPASFRIPDEYAACMHARCIRLCSCVACASRAAIEGT